VALSGAPKGVTFGDSVHTAKRGWGISLIGAKDAERLIKECKTLLNSERVQDEILPAAQLVRDVARRLVRVGPGLPKKKKDRKHLRDLIFATKGRRYNSGMIGAVSEKMESILDLTADSAGPSVIMGVDLTKAPHAHLVEFGHAQVSGGSLRVGKKKTKKVKGSVVGYVPPHPFIRPAVAACRGMIVKIIESALKRMLAPYSKD
jgi:hypothetical protein